MKYLLILIIKFYKKAISPFLKPSCRFYPTCSSYSMEAIEKHGAMKGFYLAVKRILRCQPLAKGGFDPVPECKDKNHNHDRNSRLLSSERSGNEGSGGYFVDRVPRSVTEINRNLENNIYYNPKEISN